MGFKIPGNLPVLWLQWVACISYPFCMWPVATLGTACIIMPPAMPVTKLYCSALPTPSAPPIYTITYSINACTRLCLYLKHHAHFYSTDNLSGKSQL